MAKARKETGQKEGHGQRPGAPGGGGKKHGTVQNGHKKPILGKSGMYGKVGIPIGDNRRRGILGAENTKNNGARMQEAQKDGRIKAQRVQAKAGAQTSRIQSFFRSPTMY